MSKNHWIIESMDRADEAFKKIQPCCATMEFNIRCYLKIPDWIKNKCPWCNKKLTKEARRE